MGDERIWCEGHTACQELKSRGDAMLSCRAVYNNNRVWVCVWVGGYGLSEGTFREGWWSGREWSWGEIARKKYECFENMFPSIINMFMGS